MTEERAKVEGVESAFIDSCSHWSGGVDEIDFYDAELNPRFFDPGVTYTKYHDVTLSLSEKTIKKRGRSS